ncbi:hypothetical protein LTR53_000880 [Teratosphaeriaceae sp. CCFEE 6253]|nr:hypothetical protein LTR53_000880 [Teratosphaeriaceae sp. CCFEE 6253]
MQRTRSEQATPLDYNRQLATYYRQQITALQNRSRSTPAYTPPPEDTIEPVVDTTPTKTDSIQVTQRALSSRSSLTFHSAEEYAVTTRPRRGSGESTRSTLAGTPDTATSPKPASPMSVYSTKPRRMKSRGGILRKIVRWSSGSSSG